MFKHWFKFLLKTRFQMTAKCVGAPPIPAPRTVWPHFFLLRHWSEGRKSFFVVIGL